MRNALRALALGSVLMLVAAGCSNDNGSSSPSSGASGDFSGVTITFSTSLAATQVRAVQEVLDTFQADTGATVKLTQVTWTDLPQKLQVEVNSGNHTIQLFAQDNLALRVLVDDGLVEDLSDVQIPSG